MAYYNNKTKDEKKKSNNTYGPSYYNEETMEKLTVNYWDGSMAVIVSALVRDANGRLQEDENNTLRLTVKPYTIATFASECEDIRHEVKANGGHFASAGIPCGNASSNMIEISNGANIGRDPGIYLVLYKDIDEKRTPGSMMVYTFAARTVVKNYNHKTGAGDVVKLKSQEFKDFSRTMEDFVSGMNMANAHAYKEATKYERAASSRTMAIVAASLGVDLGASYSGGNNSRKRNVFQADGGNVVNINDNGYTDMGEFDIDLDVVG